MPEPITGPLNTLTVTSKQGDTYSLSPVDAEARQEIDDAELLQFDERYFTAEEDTTNHEVNIGLAGVPFGVDGDTPLEIVQDTENGVVLGVDSPYSSVLAPKYDAASTYELNSRCMYLGKLYRCTTAISVAEAWNSSHWTEETVTGILPTVNNATLTITQNGTSKGTFTSNSADDATIALTDTTYESKAASQGGSDVSLVTTGEKYVWNDWTSENVTINKYYPPDILYYTNFENMTGLTGNQATDVPIVGDTMLYNLNMNYPSRPTLSTLSYENTILPCLLVDYNASWESIIKANSSISTGGLDEFTTECILQFNNKTGSHVYVALDGYWGNGSLQIGSQNFFGKPLAVYVPNELQSSLSVYNGASKEAPDRIKIPVNDPYVAHKHQIYYNRTLEYCEYYCDNVRYFKISKLPSWSVNLQLNIVSGGSDVPMKITQLALTSGRKTDLLYY